MYKVFIISLVDTGQGNHKKSAQLVLPQTTFYCGSNGWNYKIFPAINGWSIQDADWRNFDLLQSSKRKHFWAQPGAQGCFLSHFLLWQKCQSLNEPIVILEDDAKVIAPLLEINTTQDLVKLHKPRQINKHPTVGTWGNGAFAYWLTPDGAKKLINFSRTNGPKYVDKLIGSNILNWEHLDSPVVKLGPRVGSSTNPEKYPYRF